MVDSDTRRAIDLIEPANLVEGLTIQQDEIAGASSHEWRLQLSREPVEIARVLEHVPVETGVVGCELDVEPRGPVDDARLKTNCAA